MTFLDDELRLLLRARADGVAPRPDVMAHVERRLARMRANRNVVAVAGSALVAATVAVAAPVLFLHAGRSGTAAVPVATAPASATPAPAPTAGGLDPRRPWPYRGERGLLASREMASLRAEWQSTHPGAILTPLYGEVYGPARRPQITFVSTGGGEDRWAVATPSDAGWTFLHDEALGGTRPTVLMAALPADEVPRLLIVAAPTTGRIDYAKDGTTFRPLPVAAADAAGVAYAPLEGDTSRDRVRVLDANGDVQRPVFVGPAPDA